MNKKIIYFLSVIIVLSTSAIKKKPIDEEPIITQVDYFFESELKSAYDSSIRKNFLDHLGHLESSGNYSAVNGSYYGKYQFGMIALKDVNMDHVPLEEFLKSPSLQEEAINRLLIKNKFYLKSYIEKYSGQTHRGIFITEAGILASAHLGGSGSVKVWFDTGRVFRDGNGTPITKYMKVFGTHREFKIQ